MDATPGQLQLMGDVDVAPRDAESATFSASRKMPIHRWFHYYAGFSAEWLGGLLEQQNGRGARNVLDPFAGSGTALIEAQRAGMTALGLETHPFVCRVGRAKLLWPEPPSEFAAYANALLAEARTLDVATESENALLVRCYPEATLRELVALRTAWANRPLGTPMSELTWLALVASLRACASVNARQGQYILPNHRRESGTTAFEAFSAQCTGMVHDMVLAQGEKRTGEARLLQADARQCDGVPEDWADVVVTSPPYANNYDYADATRLEMTFLGEVSRWGDLQGAVRRHLIRSSTQHVSADVPRTLEFLADPALLPIRAELEQVCADLLAEREQHGGKKNYHTMVVLYFLDLASVWRSLRRVCRPGAQVCFVIGDSAPYGVYVPVDKWLGELARANGFADWRFEKLRDRNVKWKNRKHRVPLKEGRLWVCG